MDLNKYVIKIIGFDTITASNKIDYFVHFKIVHGNKDGIKAKDITECFDELNLSPYSNIPSYLAKNSQRGKNQKFIKKK